MPPRDWTLRIRDILEAVEKIQRYTDGMEYSSFSQDDLTVDAVLRNFSVIGEAARHLPESVAEVHPQIPWAEEAPGKARIMKIPAPPASPPPAAESGRRDR